MIEIETILELSEHLNGLVSSIKKDDLDDHDFISHKYLLISFHAHTERCKLDEAELSDSEKLQLKKQHLLYKSIEDLLSKKAHESTTHEMYEKILKCQKLVSACTS